MKAVILAAGRGSRMHTQTDDQPKCLIQWQGKSILDWQLQALNQVGIRDVAIVTGYRREKLRARMFHEFVNYQWARSSVVESLLCADEWFSASPCLALYSDIVYSPETLKPIIQPLDSLGITSYKRWLELWSLRFDDVLSDAEAFKVNDEGFVLEIGSRTRDLREIQGQFMGIVQFQPSSWERFKRAIHELGYEKGRIPDMTSVLGRIVAMNWMQVRAVEAGGVWAEFDSESDLLAAEPFAMEFRSEFSQQ